MFSYVQVYQSGVGGALPDIRFGCGAGWDDEAMTGWDAGEFEKLADQLARDGHVSAALSLNAAAHNIRNTGRPGVVCDEYCRCGNDVRRVVGCAPPRRPGVDVFHVEPANGAALDIIFDASDDSYELNIFAPVDWDGDCGCGGAEPH